MFEEPPPFMCLFLRFIGYFEIELKEMEILFIGFETVLPGNSLSGAKYVLWRCWHLDLACQTHSTSSGGVPTWTLSNTFHFYPSATTKWWISRQVWVPVTKCKIYWVLRLCRCHGVSSSKLWRLAWITYEASTNHKMYLDSQNNVHGNRHSWLMPRKEHLQNEYSQFKTKLYLFSA